MSTAGAAHRREAARDRTARAAVPVTQCGFSSTVHGNDVAVEMQSRQACASGRTYQRGAVWGYELRREAGPGGL